MRQSLVNLDPNRLLTFIFSLLIFTFVPLSASSTEAETLTIDSAINKAGRQRMLTQRMLKSYLLIGQNIAKEESQQILDQSVGLFEQQLEELEDFSPTPAIRKSFTSIRADWNHFRADIIAKPEKKNALEIISKGEHLLDLCEKSVKLIDKHAASKKGNLINISGRQRMLSQRIGMLYAAHSWGLGNDDLRAKFDKAILEYDNALSKLSKAPLNSREITGALSKVESRWNFSRSGFEQMGNERYVPYIIQVTTESMLKRMNTITGLYENVSLNAGAVAAK